MKTKILSVLLLVAMLITAVPVMVAAEAQDDVAAALPENVTNPKLFDLHDWYVQEDLVALFSGFDSSSVDFENGTWQNKVTNGENATFRDAATPYWGMQDGGIGYTMLPEVWEADAQKVGISLSESYEDLDDYTVEAFATVIGITDENGDRFVNHYQAEVKDENDVVITPASGRMYGWYKSGVKASSAFRFGLVYSLFFCSLMDNATANDSIGSRWFICNYGYVDGQPSGDRGYVITNEAGWRMGSPAVPKAGTMQVYKATTTDAETEVTSVNHRLTYNGGKDAFNTTFTKEQEATYLSQSSTDLSGRFSLFNAIPSTVYSIRVYERGLTAKEVKQNRAVDVMLYYELEIPASVAEFVEDYLFAQTASVEFLPYGSEAYTAKKAELQEMVDLRVKAEEIISLYAQRDHLTSLFTIYHEGTLDMAAGTWTDLVAGGTAKMGVPSRWFKNADGSFGYNAFVGYIDADGNANKSLDAEGKWNVNSDKAGVDALGNVPTANHVFWKNNELSFGIDKMPADDFTFEYMAMYRPLLVADASKSTKDNLVYATDANGDLLKAYDVFGTTAVTTDYGDPPRKAVDVIGHFTTITQRIDSSSGWGSSVRGTQHWMYDTFDWNNARNWVGGPNNSWGATSGLAVSGDAFKKNDVINVYAITLDETVTADSATGNFGLYRNGKLYKENNGGFTWESASGAYNPDLTASCSFYLSCCQPTDFYAARVYDVVLTEAEKKQNVAIDVILYYGLDVSAVRDDADKMASLYTLLSAETFLTDPTAKAARAAYLQFVIDREDLASDLSEKYAAGENLTALFTVFAPGSVNLTAGTWTDIIGGKTATLGNASKGYWRMGEHGSVGFDIFYGTVDADGNFVADSTYNNYAVNGTRLDFGIAMLPKDDFTVEFVSQVNPVYVADSDGKIAVSNGSVVTPEGTVSIAAGEKISTFLVNPIYNKEGVFTGYNTPGSQQYGAAAYGAVYQLGYFAGYTSNRDGIHGGYTGRGAILWTTSATAWNWGNSTQISGWNYSGTINTAAFDARVYTPNGSIHTYAVQRAEFDDTEAAESYRGATYTLFRDAAFYVDRVLTKASMDDATSKNASYQPVNYATDDTGYFYLGERLSTEFYTVRIYDKALTEAEQQQNRAVDVIFYYGLALSDKTWADDAAMQDIYTALYAQPLLTDAVAKAAKKHELQLIVSGSSVKDEMLSLYARPESMTHLYTTYAPQTVDLTTGKWADLLSDATATFGDKAQWKLSECGGIGFNVFRGNMEDTDGDGYKETFNKELVVGQNYHNTALRLDFGIDQLPKDDFTVDYMAMYKPVYVYDADEADKIARDQNGNKLEVYNLDLTATAWHYDYEIDQLGWFTNIAAALDGKDQNWSGTTRGATHWMFNNPDWYCGNNGSWVGVDWKGEIGGLAISGNPYHTFGEIHNYAITLDETLTVTDGVRETSAVFALYRDAAIYNSNTHSTANNAEGVELKDINQNGYFDIEQEWFDIKNITNGEWISRSFWLSSTRPTDFYTVRIYDVALTDDEKVQNRFVDMLYYYDVEIPETLKNNAAKLIELGKDPELLGFATDATAKAANKALIESKIDALSKTVTIKFKTETLDTVKIMNDTFTLPAVIDGMAAIAWKVNGASDKHLPGEKITVTGDTTLTPTLFTLPATNKTQSVRYTNVASELGMRFTAELYRNDYTTLVALYGAENVKLGMLIAPDAYVRMAGAFTREALTAMIEESASVSKDAYIDFDSIGFYTVGSNVLTLAATVVNFKENTYKNNPAFAAIAYIDVDTDDNGTYDMTIYGNYDQSTSATVKNTLMNARVDATTTQQGWIDSLLKNFGA